MKAGGPMRYKPGKVGYLVAQFLHVEGLSKPVLVPAIKSNTEFRLGTGILLQQDKITC